MNCAVIIGSGSYIPKLIIKKNFFLNQDFFDDHRKKIKNSTKEIVNKFIEITEIKERRYLSNKLMNSDMAKIAGEKALINAGINKEILDYLIVAHNSSEVSINKQIQLIPSFSVRVKNKLNIKSNQCKAYDMIYGCAGWNESLIMASQFIKANIAKNILIIGSDNLSRFLDPYDRNSMIFSDGAGAVVLQSKKTNTFIGIINHISICDSNEEINYIRHSYSSLNPNYLNSNINIKIQGRKVYEYALKKVPVAIKCMLDKSGFHLNDIHMILLHQANAKMDKAIIQRLFKLYNLTKIPYNFSPMTVQYLGNSSVASIPTMYDLIAKRYIKEYKFKSGNIILFASVGSGMVINIILYKIP